MGSRRASRGTHDSRGRQVLQSLTSRSAHATELALSWRDRSVIAEQREAMRRWGASRAGSGGDLSYGG